MTRAKDRAAAKKAIVAFIDKMAPEWKSIASQIHEHPELGLKEEKASTWLTEALMRHGFKVQRNVGKLRTAFVGRAGGVTRGAKAKPSGPSIAFLAEYDALPGLGHACSHNLIGVAACLGHEPAFGVPDSIDVDDHHVVKRQWNLLVEDLGEKFATLSELQIDQEKFHQVAMAR